MGCGCLVLVLVALIIGGLFLKNRIEDFIENEVAEFVTDEPVELPEVSAESKEIDALIDRFDTFREEVSSVGEEQAPQRLELDSREINILIAHHPLFADIANKARVELQDGIITAQVSFPLDNLIPVVGGGYLNGQAAVSLRAENGAATLILESLEVNGKALPEEIMSQLKGENLLEDGQTTFGRVESIVVQDSVLIIEGKAAR